MIILCEFCDFRCLCYDDWMQHLLSENHQDKICGSIDSWGLPQCQRSLVVTIHGPKPEKADICWHFANYGFVTDALFDKKMEFCVIQLDKIDYAENAFLCEHIVGEAKLSVRSKAKMSQEDWLFLRNKETPETKYLKLRESFQTVPIEYQIDLLAKEVRMNSDEMAVRQQILEHSTKLFRNNSDFRKCILCPYGAFVTGFGSGSAIFTIYFDDQGATGGNDKVGEKMSLEEILDGLRRMIDNLNRNEVFCYDFASVSNGTASCIKFTHALTKVKCKLTFESLHPVQRSKLIALVMRLDPRLPDLLMLIRYWGEYHKLTGPKQITIYSINLLLLVFLTQKKIIPSVSILQSMSTNNDSTKISGWDTTFCEDIDKIKNLMSFFGSGVSPSDIDQTTGKPNADSVLKLMAEFCHMYAHLDLQSVVVSPSIGELVPKVHFEPGRELGLPAGLNAYKTLVNEQKSITRLDTSPLLCIQDPFVLNINVSAETPQDIVWKFQFTCADTVANIQSVFMSPSPNLMDIFKNSSSKPETLSVPRASSSVVFGSTFRRNTCKTSPHKTATHLRNLESPKISYDSSLEVQTTEHISDFESYRRK